VPYPAICDSRYYAPGRITVLAPRRGRGRAPLSLAWRGPVPSGAGSRNAISLQTEARRRPRARAYRISTSLAGSLNREPASSTAVSTISRPALGELQREKAPRHGPGQAAALDQPAPLQPVDLLVTGAPRSRGAPRRGRWDAWHRAGRPRRSASSTRHVPGAHAEARPGIGRSYSLSMRRPSATQGKWPAGKITEVQVRSLPPPTAA